MSADTLQFALRSTHHRLLAITGLACALDGATILLSAALAAIVLDATAGFPTLALAAADVAVIATLAWRMIELARVLHRNRYHDRRMARFIEERMAWGHNPLINAVELGSAEAMICSPALAMMSVRQGRIAAEKIVPAKIVDSNPLGRSALRFSGILLLLTAIHLLLPGLIPAVSARLLNPAGDLPPFTLAKFELSIEPQAIHVGDPAGVLVKATHPFGDLSHADLIPLGDAAAAPQPMARRSDGRFVLPFARVDRSLRFRIIADSLRSPDYQMTVLPTPVFRSAQVRLEYPAYTGWPAIDRPLEDTTLSFLAGTKITFKARSNLPLAGGQISLDGLTLPLAAVAADPMHVTGEFTPAQSVNYRLSLTAADGTPSRETISGQINAIPDQPPIVQLLAPDLRVVAPEGWPVPLAAAAQDDVAVTRAVLHQWLDYQKPKAVELPLKFRTANRASAESSAVIELTALGARAGQTVHGFVTVTDNHPNPPQSADSPTFQIIVVTMREYQDLARQQYRTEHLLREIEAFGQQQKKLDELRQKLLEALDKNPRQLEEIRKLLAEYEQSSEDLAQQMKERADQPPIYDFEKPYQKLLSELAAQLRKQAQEAKKHSSSLDASRLSQLKEQLNRDGQAAGQTAKQQETAENQMRQLEAADAMSQEGETIKQLADDQKRLAERLMPYRDKAPLSDEDKARASQLAAEQRQLEQALIQSLQRLDEAAAEAEGQLPTMSRSARELTQKIRQAGIDQDQRQAARAAEAGEGQAAQEAAQQAAGKLAGFIKSCNGMCDNAGEDLDGVFGLTRSQLQNAMNQLQSSRKSGSGNGSGTAGGGGGSGGSQPTVLGPRSGSGGRMKTFTSQSQSKSGSFNRLDAQGRIVESRDLERLNPLNPAGRLADTRGGATVGGVPMQYRELMNQYFRRLATEKKP